MNTPDNEGIQYVSTTKLALTVAGALEGSVVPFLRRDMGFRFFSPQKYLYGLIAGVCCIVCTQGLQPPAASGYDAFASAAHRYERGGAELFFLAYLLAGAVQWSRQRKRLRDGAEIHSHSSGWPLIGDLFPKAGYHSLLALEILALFALGVGAEALRIPFGPWLWASACALFVRGRIDAYAQQIADADVIDAALDGETMARKLRARRGGAFG